MLRCNEPTISCSCSSVGRLTVDMGPPKGVAATAAGAAGAEFRDGATRDPFGAEPGARALFASGRAAPSVRKALANGPFTGGTLGIAGGGDASRELPRPT